MLGSWACHVSILCDGFDMNPKIDSKYLRVIRVVLPNTRRLTFSWLNYPANRIEKQCNWNLMNQEN